MLIFPEIGNVCFPMVRGRLATSVPLFMAGLSPTRRCCPLFGTTVSASMRRKPGSTVVLPRCRSLSFMPSCREATMRFPPLFSEFGFDLIAVGSEEVIDAVHDGALEDTDVVVQSGS